MEEGVVVASEASDAVAEEAEAGVASDVVEMAALDAAAESEEDDEEEPMKELLMQGETPRCLRAKIARRRLNPYGESVSIDCAVGPFT